MILPKPLKLLFTYMLLSSSLSLAQTAYLDSESWTWLNNAAILFQSAYSDAVNSTATASAAQQYVQLLAPLFETSLALEGSLRQKQNDYLSQSTTIPTDLIYLTTAISAFSSSLSSLSDYFQQLQSPVASPSTLRNSLRITQLNNTIYTLALTLYKDYKTPPE